MHQSSFGEKEYTSCWHSGPSFILHRRAVLQRWGLQVDRLRLDQVPWTDEEAQPHPSLRRWKYILHGCCNSTMAKQLQSVGAFDMACGYLAMPSKPTARRNPLQARNYFLRARRPFSSGSKRDAHSEDRARDVRSAREYCSELVRYARSLYLPCCSVCVVILDNPNTKTISEQAKLL